MLTKPFSVFLMIDWKQVISQIFFVVYALAFAVTLIGLFFSVSWLDQFKAFDTADQAVTRNALDAQRQKLEADLEAAKAGHPNFPDGNYPDYVGNSPEVLRAYNLLKNEQGITDTLNQTKLGLIQSRERNQLLAQQERAQLEAARRRAEAEAEAARRKKEADANAWKQFIPNFHLNIH